MVNRVQSLRSSTPLNMPSPGARQPGELWVNFPDMQFGLIDASQTAQKLLAIRYFSTLTNYVVGDFVVYNGQILSAAVAIAAGPFNQNQWNQNVMVSDVGQMLIGYLPTTGGALTGGLALNGTAANRFVGGQTNGLYRWALNFGDNAPEGGGNAGSNFTLLRFNDIGALIDTPLSVNRANGQVSFGSPLILAADPIVPLGAATKQYADKMLPLAGGTLTGLLNAQAASFAGPVTLAANPTAPLQPATKQYVDVLPVAMNDNRLINGDMRIDQRNAGASGAASGYTVDRWEYSASQVDKIAWQRQANPSGLAQFGFGSAVSLQSPSAYVSAATDYFQFFQPIEADLVSDFAWGTANAQPVTLSFWVTSSLTGTYSGSISNDAGTRCYPFTFPVTTGWSKVLITIPGDTAGTWVMSGNGAGPRVTFDLGSGANYRGPAGAWASTTYIGATGTVSLVGNAATLFVTGVKLEIGSVATPFPRQSLAKSMADCQRYYQNLVGGVTGYAGAAGIVIGDFCFYPVTMRAIPTTTIGATIGTDINDTGVAIDIPSAGSFRFNLTAAGAGQVQALRNFTVSAEL